LTHLLNELNSNDRGSRGRYYRDTVAQQFMLLVDELERGTWEINQDTSWTVCSLGGGKYCLMSRLIFMRGEIRFDRDMAVEWWKIG